jgi:phosphoglycerate kinase
MIDQQMAAKIREGNGFIAALDQSGAADDFSFLSTAGGAFLEWMEGRTHPGVAAPSRGDECES